MSRTNQVRIAALIIVAVLLAAPSAVEAMIGPPVSVRLLGEPKPARDGEVYEGVLEVVADEAIELSGFRLEGDGWRVVSLDAPMDAPYAKGARLELRFSATPGVAEKPLIVAFEAGGQAVRHALDLSERHYRRMTEGGAAVPLPKDARIFTAPFVRVPTVPTVDLPADVTVREAPTGAQVYNITVSGGWYYRHPIAGWVGADEMFVRVWHRSTFIPMPLAAGYTATNGRYSFTFAWDPMDGLPDIYVSFSTQAGHHGLVDHTYEESYYWSTGTWYDFPGTSLNVGDLTSGDETLMPAMHILANMTRNWRWHNSYGYDPGTEWVYWPADGQYHNGQGVHISDSWHEGGYAHEYGHHWQTVFAPAGNFNYCNGFCDSPAPCNHCGWCRENVPVPTMEGFCYWLGDIVPRVIEQQYGLPLNAADDAEPVFTCPDDGTYHDPNSTEGFYAALLRDIYDDTPDAHAAMGSWHDASHEDAQEIFNVIHAYNPTTPLNFLMGLMASYPAMVGENLWETAINCGFNIDTAAPGTVTNLHSTSHTVNVSSADRTIDFAWTHAPDDAAGIMGYGITIAASRGLPSAVQDLGKVTTYTTSSLPSGSWYFSIRARDRAGNWSSSYAWVGPYVVRDAQPSDLQPHLSFGWTLPLVPRADATATGTNVPEPVTLTGNAASTWWNLNGLNDGETATGAFSARIYVDGVYADSRSWTTIGAGGNYMVTNDGPLTVRGGRHTFEVFHDAAEQVAETDETDNRWAHPWIWTPQSLATGSLTARTAPPAHTAGWDAVVDGSPLYYNCDGLSFATANYVDGSKSWDAVYVYAGANDEDYDCRLHTHTTGASDGFAGNLGWSARPAGYLDGLLVNGNAAGFGTRDVGVLNDSGGSGQYRVGRLRATAIALDGTATVPVAEYEMMVFRRFEVAVADTGFYTISVSVDPPTQAFQLQTYLPTFTTGTIGSYSGRASTTTGSVKLTRHVTQTGWHAFIVFRDPSQGTAPCTFTIGMTPTPPDFTPAVVSGWQAPFVPRPLADGTPTLVAAPDTLHGNANATYFNYARLNNSPAGWVYDGVHTANAHAMIDGEVNLGGVGVTSFSGWQVRTTNQTSARTVTGGRHVAAMVLDLGGDIAELDETNNVYGEQYCWSPQVLSFATPVTRSAPPDRTGGWSQVTNGAVLWYNCDGLRLPAGTAESWRAVAVMPAADADVDARLHFTLTGATNGFTTNLATSGWGTGESDFVLVCAHDFFVLPAMVRPLDAGVVRVAGTSAYTAEAVIGTPLTPGSGGTFGPYTLGAQHLMHLYSVWLTPGIWGVRLDSLSGSVDWGLSAYAPDYPFKNKSGTTAGGLAYLQGAGVSEGLNIDVANAGWYAVAVWKQGAADLALSGTYQLRVLTGVTGVPDELPAGRRTGLVSVLPNPFNPATNITFRLAAAEPVRLSVYGLDGRLVRVLVNGLQVAGDHEVRWNGTDDRGQPMASGIYFCRLEAGTCRETRRMTLVK